MSTMIPNVVDVEIKYDRSSVNELVKRAPELADQLSLRPTDQFSLNTLGEFIRAAKDWIRAIKANQDPVCEATDKAHKAAVRARKELLSPVEAPLELAERAAAQFVANVRAEQERKQREAEEEQRKLNEAEARRTAKVLKDMGASKDQIQEVREEIRATPAPVIQPKAEVAQGMSVRTLYSVEVTDLKAFVAHLAQDPYLLILFGYSATFKKAIEGELRGEASKRKDQYDIPGTKLIKTASGAWR
jgi:multidrug efflux pump subunit AcrA (membrane-fusion protein)